MKSTHPCIRFSTLRFRRWFAALLAAQIIKIQKSSYEAGIQEAQNALTWEKEKQKLLNILNHEV